MQYKSFLLSISLIFLFISSASEVHAQSSTILQLKSMPSARSRLATLTADVVEVESWRVFSSTTVRAKRTSLRAQVPSVPSLVFVNYFDSKNKKSLEGRSAVLRPNLGIARAISIKLVKKFATALHVTARASGSSVQGVVAVPRSSFTTRGPGLSKVNSNGEADMVITDLVQSSCYNKEGSFVITEVEPHRVAARNAEIALSNSPYADPSLRLVDHSVPPSNFVSGTMVSDGKSLTITLSVRDSNGNLLASSSAKGALDNWFNIHLKTMGALASEMCKAKPVSISIEAKSCPTTTCKCCSESSASCNGVSWTEVWSGTIHGPVGTTLQVNSVPDNGSLECAGWTNISCAPLLCCRRENSSQPEEISYTASRGLPSSIPCICPRPSVFDINLVAQAIATIAVDEKIVVVKCPGS